MTYRPDVEAGGGAVPPPGCPAHAGSVGLGAPARPAAQGLPLYGPEFAADPHFFYERLRQYGPIAPVELSPGVEAYLITSYSLALEVLRDTERFAKDPRGWRALNEGRIPPDSPVGPMMMYRPNALFNDGEAHARLRGVITDSLTRLDPYALSEYVERSADTLINGFADKGEADLLGDYAAAVPLLVFNQLFGYPAEHGLRLIGTMAKLFDSGEEAAQANEELLSYIANLIAGKRERPGADITSWMIAHPSRLADEELMQQLILILAAGTEPQLNLIANALRLLLSDDRFAGELAGGSMPVQDAIDEVLWTDPPMANYGTLFARRDLDLAGVRIRQGEPVLTSYAAANTDPELISDGRLGNRAHLAWGIGAHRCPAESPARVIASVAIEKLLDRLPDVELAVPVDQLSWRPGPFHRALATLPVRFPVSPVTAQPAAHDAPAAVSAPAPATALTQPHGAPQATSAPQATPAASATPSQPGHATQRRRGGTLAAWWRGQ
ncbi:cytochrome P450 [Streptomyces sp. ME19-01-6]|uniref:cytochrome P450 n=1 Tax=Streptomyces sp. ME19-01-6 TaxID=3028686 RepID=UPI0029ADD671|nr:cytochrome P450 [Streptomyces sp. ME19-01-6]MDX3230205.1 cytochrome P450 [Streptomyces sp. ME19-01-6]